MIDERLVIIAFALNFLGGISYIKGILSGAVKPNKVTWLLWGIIPMIAFSAQISEGVGWSSLMTFAVGFFPFIIFALSFKSNKTEWKISKLDVVCGLMSCVGIVLWILTKNGDMAILFAVFADGCAALPTVIKAFKFPETEDLKGFLFPGIGAFITLLTLNNWHFSYSAFPIYILAIDTILVSLIKFKPGKLFLK